MDKICASNRIATFVKFNEREREREREREKRLHKNPNEDRRNPKNQEEERGRWKSEGSKERGPRWSEKVIRQVVELNFFCWMWVHKQSANKISNLRPKIQQGKLYSQRLSRTKKRQWLWLGQNLFETRSCVDWLLVSFSRTIMLKLLLAFFLFSSL